MEPIGNKQGGHVLMNFKTWEEVTWHGNINELSVTDMIIKAVEHMDLRQTMKGFKVQNIEKIFITPTIGLQEWNMKKMMMTQITQTQQKPSPVTTAQATMKTRISRKKKYIYTSNKAKFMNYWSMKHHYNILTMQHLYMICWQMKNMKYHHIIPIQPSKMNNTPLMKMLWTRMTFMREITEHNMNNILYWLDNPFEMFQRCTTI